MQQKFKKKQAVDCYDCIFDLEWKIAVAQTDTKIEWIGIFGVRLIMLNPQTSNDLV